MTPGTAVITPTLDIGRVTATKTVGLGPLRQTVVSVELPGGVVAHFPQSSLAVRQVNKVSRPFQIIQGGKLA